MVDNERGSEGDPADVGSDPGLVGGGPTTTVSDDGIDEVFEKLQEQASDPDSLADRSGGGTRSSGASASDAGVQETGVEGSTAQETAAGGSTARATGDGDAGAVGSLSGGPKRTVSEESVDDILERVGTDVDYATFDGVDAPDGVADTEVDPDAVLPDTGDGETAADAVDDEHAPPESADDLRPDDSDGAMVDLLADAADDVGEPDDDTTVIEFAPTFDAGESVRSDGALEDVGLNDPDDRRIEWSDDGGEAPTDGESGALASDGEADDYGDGPGRVFGAWRARGVVARIRSLLARFV